MIIAVDKNNLFVKNKFFNSLNSLREESFEKIKSRVHFINLDKELNQTDFNQLEKILKFISDQVYDQFDNETENLFKSKQYDIALLMGYITLEKSLRNFYKDSRFSSYKISDRLIKDEIITLTEAETLVKARNLRNNIVHGISDHKLNKDEVKKYLDFFKIIQERLLSATPKIKDL
ncbi:hypothetical protein [Acinetobacter soli]|uniref:hypothetical protein n=1 Tax=Acinetobacter soli TaxID=487316 RepID=UPI002FF2C51C|nr:hypothetical protein PX669_09280 [Acinetobacter soli]WEI10159.1 hypothetical protein PYR73_03565 [Acinetobacter soli]